MTFCRYLKVDLLCLGGDFIDFFMLRKINFILSFEFGGIGPRQMLNYVFLLFSILKVHVSLCICSKSSVNSWFSCWTVFKKTMFLFNDMLDGQGAM